MFRKEFDARLSKVLQRWSISGTAKNGYLSLIIALVLFWLAPSLNHAMDDRSNQVKNPNILLILVDDLKPAIGAYRNDTAITPEMDKLAIEFWRLEIH